MEFSYLGYWSLCLPHNFPILDPYPLFVLRENMSLGESGVMQIQARLGEGASVLS